MNIYEVYDQFHNEFIKFGIYIAKDDQVAADLVQDVYIKAMEQEERFEVMNEAEAKNWFLKCMKNRWIDILRKEKRVVYLQEEESFKETKEHFDYENLLEEEVINKIDTQDMLSKLSEDSRRLLTYRYVNEFDSIEIGNILNMNPSTVRTKISRVIKSLQSTYDTGGTEDEKHKKN